MEQLKTLLLSGHHALVVRQNGIVHTFDDSGLRALVTLLTTSPQALSGAEVADKVVGRAAAALLIRGGVKRLYTPLISETAIKLLENSDIDFTYDATVPFIQNKARDGMCPMEALALGAPDAEEAATRILDRLSPKKSNS